MGTDNRRIDQVAPDSAISNTPASGRRGPGHCYRTLSNEAREADTRCLPHLFTKKTTSSSRVHGVCICKSLHPVFCPDCRFRPANYFSLSVSDGDKGGGVCRVEFWGPCHQLFG